MLPGVYNVSLIVDGKSIETRPLRVMADPEVSLTEVERKRMYDMAMEMHDLQKRVSDVNSAFTAVNRQIPAIQKTMEGRSDLPADVKIELRIGRQVAARDDREAGATGRRSRRRGRRAGAAVRPAADAAARPTHPSRGSPRQRTG